MRKPTVSEVVTVGAFVWPLVADEILIRNGRPSVSRTWAEWAAKHPAAAIGLGSWLGYIAAHLHELIPPQYDPLRRWG